jgi:hypothetical protein
MLVLSIADIACGRLAELGLMIAGYDAVNGTVRLMVREELPCGHPATGLRANKNGSRYCLACRRTEAPARKRISCQPLRSDVSDADS